MYTTDYWDDEDDPIEEQSIKEETVVEDETEENDI